MIKAKIVLEKQGNKIFYWVNESLVKETHSPNTFIFGKPKDEVELICKCFAVMEIPAELNIVDHNSGEEMYY